MKAKKKITRLWSILLTFVMVAGMLPTVALAEELAPATTMTAETDTETETETDTDKGMALAAEPTQVTETADFTSSDKVEDARELLGTNATWDGDTNTLTLNGVNFTTANQIALKLPANSTIVLADGTTNTITCGTSSNVASNAIVAIGALTITGEIEGEGNGKLIAGCGGAPKSFSSFAINSSDGNLIITNCIVNATSGTAQGSEVSCGIYAGRYDVTISNSTVNATGGAGYNSYGIYAGNLTIDDGADVDATGGAAERNSYGIYAHNTNNADNGNVTISGDTTNVNATGGSATGSGDKYSYGIYAHTNVEISGGTVTATGGTATDSNYDGRSYGIYAGSGSVGISGGTVTATGGTANYSYGIHASSNITISNSTVTATGGEAEKRSYGIYANNGNVNISGGTVTAEGGEAEKRSYGIFAGSNGSSQSGNVSISGGTVTAKGAEATYDSYGIFASGSVTINDGADVDATGGTAGDLSFGIHAEGSVTINSGAVTATGGAASNNQSFGIRALNNALTITGGTVTATGGDAKISSNGLWAGDGSVTISGGTVVAESGRVMGVGASSGIYAQNVVIENDSGTPHVTATGGTAQDGTSYGINAVSGGTVTFSGGTLTAAATAATKGYSCINGTLYVTGEGVKTISFYSNGGVGTMMAKTTAAEYTLPANGFTPPDGKQFKGWATSAGGEVISGSLTVDGDKTLYAIWETVPVTSYTVTYTDGVGGSAFADQLYTVAEGDATPAFVGTPTRSGYRFKGWTPDVAATVTDNAIYTANWAKKSTGSSGGSYTPPTNTVTADSAKNGNVAISTKNAAKGTIVTLTIVPDKGYKLDTVTVTDKNGNEIELTDKGNGEYTFQMPATEVNVETTFVEEALIEETPIEETPIEETPTEEIPAEDNTMMNFFVDVPDHTYYYNAVLWAAKNGITGGMDETHFAPDVTCTRVQAITFLWRAAGSPMPKSTEMPFEDVEADSYYYYAVLWAIENGITSGTSATTFSPDATCSRGQIVTFLWRAENSPAVGTDNSFTDVASDSYYADATNWAVANGITAGTGDGTTFGPDANCDRAQIVTFLYRFFM